mgnify:CR=1 FL=1
MRPITNLTNLGQLASGYSRKMADLAYQAATDPTIVEDPNQVAQFQIAMYNAQSGFQLASRSIQDLHKEDQILNEMLRDA